MQSLRWHSAGCASDVATCTPLPQETDPATGVYTGPTTLAIAVSETRNPLGRWRRYFYDTTFTTAGDPALGPFFPDYPQVRRRGRAGLGRPVAARVGLGGSLGCCRLGLGWATRPALACSQAPSLPALRPQVTVTDTAVVLTTNTFNTLTFA